jgi:adenylate kinase
MALAARLFRETSILAQHVILLGPQGSGKGTQAERVAPRVGLAIIATGELFRTAMREGTELGQRIKTVYDRGDLVPDDLTIALVAQRLDELARAARFDGALYDGFPRTLAQAEELDRLLESRDQAVTSVVAIDVPRQRLMQRLSGRRVCAQCGRVYNVALDPSVAAGPCPACGGELIQRADDTPQAIAKRLDLYETETAPLADYYARRGLLRRVNGDQPIEAVTESIVAAIENRQTVGSTSRP